MGFVKVKNQSDPSPRLLVYSYFCSKGMEKSIKSPLLRCKTASTVCSKLEDEAAAFLVGCYTSPTSVKSSIVELMQIENAAQKLASALEVLTNSSVSSSGLAESEAVECTALIESIVKIKLCFLRQVSLEVDPPLYPKPKLFSHRWLKWNHLFPPKQSYSPQNYLKWNMGQTW